MCRYFYYVLGAVVVVSMIAYLIYQYRNSLKWRRYIDDWWLIVSLLSCEAIIFILCYYKFGMSADNDNFWGIAGTISAVLLGLIVYRAQKRVMLYQIVNRISGELSEIYRHLGENMNVIECIDLTKGVPSQLHIRKLAITKYSSLSDEETLRNLDKKHNKFVFPMTVMVRNYNINVEIINEFLQSPNLTEPILREHLQGILEVTESLRGSIERCFEAMAIGEKLPVREKKHKWILYERSW